MKLNLGCGDDIREGYLNIDLYNDKADVKLDVTNLTFFESNSIDEVLAYHLIEHFNVLQADEVLKEWYRVLKPGGIFKIETPDLLSTCRAFLEWPEEWRPFLYGHMFAKAWIPGEVHMFLYTEQELYNKLKQTGFRQIIRTEPDSSYYYERDKWNPELYLHFTCVK